MLSHAQASIKLIFLSAILLASISGCMDGALDFQIQFDNVHGLKKGDAVYFEKAEIGTVEEVDYTDSGDFLVNVSIQKEFATAATDDSKFYIDFHPQDRDRKTIQVVQLEKDGNPIEEDAVVDGHMKYAVLYEQFANELGKNLSIFESGINDFFRAFQDFSDADKIREIEKQLDEIIAELGHMSRDMKDNFENEILPLLREKIEELRKRLERSGQEEDLDAIDRKMETVTDTLRI